MEASQRPGPPGFGGGDSTLPWGLLLAGSPLPAWEEVMLAAPAASRAQLVLTVPSPRLCEHRLALGLRRCPAAAPRTRSPSATPPTQQPASAGPPHSCWSPPRRCLRSHGASLQPRTACGHSAHPWGGHLVCQAQPDGASWPRLHNSPPCHCHGPGGHSTLPPHTFLLQASVPLKRIFSRPSSPCPQPSPG